MQYISRYAIAFVLPLLISFSAQAQNDDVKLMMSDIAKKKSTPVSLNDSIRKGKDRAVLCNQCHGADGISKKPDIPNLAGQNPVYLLNQIEKFADGRRKNFVMNALSKNFTRDDKENLAIFYASLKVKPMQADAHLAGIGKPVYETRCASCHGVNGAGQADFARLAGQQVKYVETTLLKFRGKSTETNASAKRSNAIMESIASSLSVKDIKAVSAYIAQLK